MKEDLSKENYAKDLGGLLNFFLESLPPINKLRSVPTGFLIPVP